MITIYGSSSCIPCRNTKRYLDKKQITYNYIDITVDQVGAETIANLGYSSIPVIVTDDDHWTGFQPNKLDALIS